MKMRYEKPVVAVDQFKLSQAIAGCAIKVGFTDSLCFLNSDAATVESKALAAVGYFIPDSCGQWIQAGTTMDQFGNPSSSYDGPCYHTNANGAITS